MLPGDLRYALVYDVVADGYADWWVPAAGAATLAGVGVALWLYRRGRLSSPMPAWLPAAVPFLAAWVLAAGGATYRPYAALRDGLRSGAYTVVEGCVRDFRPGDPGDHHEEEWTVDSGEKTYRYRYVRSALTPGFRQTAAHGGPIRSGLRVRIADVGGHIARLEVAP